jgi:4-hydroxybenzoate polyprenyltransferase
MSWNTKTILSLGRVSNLPTVWSNTLAGVVLAGASPVSWNLLPLLLAMSMAYIGGMFLNDAFDRKIDAKERPERPIPSGQIKAAEVFAAGFTLLAGAIIFSFIAALSWNGSVGMTVVVAFALAGAIVLYDYWHKNNKLSPVIMGACRMLVYLVAAYAASANPNTLVYWGALVVLAYLIGLTYVAKQENTGSLTNWWPVLFLLAPIGFGAWLGSLDMQVLIPVALLVALVAWCIVLIRRAGKGDIPRAVTGMIAGIALVDAIFIAATSSMFIAGFAIAAFALTLFLQRYIAGT